MPVIDSKEPTDEGGNELKRKVVLFILAAGMYVGVFALFYISYIMYKNDYVDININYKMQPIVMNWWIPFMIGTVFFLMAFYLTGLNEHIPGFRTKKKKEKKIKLTRVERRAKEREKNKKK